MEDDINKKIGKKIASIRNEKGMLQADLANKSDISAEYISRLERGINAPSIATLGKISKALTVEIQDLLNFSEFEDEWEIEIEPITIKLRSKSGRTVEKVFHISCDTKG